MSRVFDIVERAASRALRYTPKPIKERYFGTESMDAVDENIRYVGEFIEDSVTTHMIKARMLGLRHRIMMHKAIPTVLEASCFCVGMFSLALSKYQMAGVVGGAIAGLEAYRVLTRSYIDSLVESSSKERDNMQSAFVASTKMDGMSGWEEIRDVPRDE